MDLGITGKTALVLASSQGLGLGIVLRMAEQGADIVIADLSEENAAAAADKVRELGRKAEAIANAEAALEIEGQIEHPDLAKDREIVAGWRADAAAADA